ncbi:MAG: hypothetical protein U1F43_27955 [Myxococcota bacterium]
MKSHEVENWISVRRMPPGRRQWALKNALAQLPESATELRALASDGVEADGSLISLLLRFKSGQAGPDARLWPPEVVNLDVLVDRKVGDLCDLFRTLASLFASKPKGALWQRLLAATFPLGAAYYTAKPYIEEAAAIAALKAEIGKPEWADLIREALVQEALAELDEVYLPYAALVAKFVSSDRVTWEEVKALDLANHRRLCLVVAGIQRELAGDVDVRKAALEPIARQDQEVYEYLRDHRKPEDIDPATAPTTDPTTTAPSGSGVADQPTA